MEGDYQLFRDLMDELDKFIEKTETKEIDGEVHITIDDNNVEEFRDLMNRLTTVASSDGDFVEEILEFLNEQSIKITDRNMIAKFIPLFAAIQCLAQSTKLPDPNQEVKVDDWVFELNSFEALDARVGKVVDIIDNEGVRTIKIKAPLAGEFVEWEDATFIVIEGMEKMIKIYQEKYTKIF